eukprot:2456957-Prymnesium_polylepis.1
MTRFAVSQQREDGSWKIRPCDNAASGGHNDATSLGETITCERADFPTRMVAAFWSHLGGGSWRMQLWARTTSSWRTAGWATGRPNSASLCRSTRRAARHAILSCPA